MFIAALSLMLPVTPVFAQQQSSKPDTTLIPTGTADGSGSQSLPRGTPERSATITEVTLGAATWDGDFGGRSNSNIAAVLLNVRRRMGELRIEATLPWMRVRSPTTIFAGIDGTPLVLASASPMTSRRRQGIGDLTLGASWLAVRQSEVGVDVDLSGRVKLPTAAGSTGLSTNRTDYAFGAEVSRSMGVLTPIARIRYRIFGDPPGWHIRNGIATSVGISAALPRHAVLLVSYDFAERTSRFIAPSHELLAGASAPISRSLRLTAYASGGLSSGAADVSVGASLTLAI